MLIVVAIGVRVEVLPRLSGSIAIGVAVVTVGDVRRGVGVLAAEVLLAFR